MPKRILRGIVLSNKAQKTVVVQVERRYPHPLLQKIIRKTKKYMVHHEKNNLKIGDVVFIQESIPISKHKKWVIMT